ncbi:MAG: hypothetical protein V7K48_03615 [Nostoc sp.]|uniref:hypothetical protein n=1 Tax=Nostoc sp. TaxID=1180 RepID=UPI002FFA3C79
MTKVKVELIDVYCRDTEDVTGADDFYLVGGLVGGKTTKAILTTPIKINDKQRKSFKPDQAILFEGEIPEGQSVKGGLKAYDEDFTKNWAEADRSKNRYGETVNWAKYGETVKKISSAISGAIAATGSQEAVAGTILSAATTAEGILDSLKKDDLLGSTELEISSTGPSHEERAWKISTTAGWSTWDYTLTYRITRS